MGVAEAQRTVPYVDEVAEAARARHGVPDWIAARARDVTRRKFGLVSRAALDHSERRRVRAYFDAVVRRTVMRSNLPGARECRIRMMTAVVEADLRASGADQERIDRELAAWLASYSVAPEVRCGRQRAQRRVDEYTTDPPSRSNTHRRVLSRVPPSEPHTSKTTQLAFPSTVAASP